MSDSYSVKHLTLRGLGLGLPRALRPEMKRERKEKLEGKKKTIAWKKKIPEVLRKMDERSKRIVTIPSRVGEAVRNGVAVEAW